MTTGRINQVATISCRKPLPRAPQGPGRRDPSRMPQPAARIQEAQVLQRVNRSPMSSQPSMSAPLDFLRIKETWKAMPPPCRPPHHGDQQPAVRHPSVARFQVLPAPPSNNAPATRNLSHPSSGRDSRPQHVAPEGPTVQGPVIRGQHPFFRSAPPATRLLASRFDTTASHRVSARSLHPSPALHAADQAQDFRRESTRSSVHSTAAHRTTDDETHHAVPLGQTFFPFQALLPAKPAISDARLTTQFLASQIRAHPDGVHSSCSSLHRKQLCFDR